MLRRRRWTRALVVAAAFGLLGAVAAPAAPAAAQEDCYFAHHTLDDGTEVLIWTCGDDGEPGSGGGSGGASCEVMIGGQMQNVPCVHPQYGWFTNAHGGCYVNPATPQPPAGDPAWEGNDPEDGTVYMAACYAMNMVDGHPYTHFPISMYMESAEPAQMPSLDQAIAQLGITAPAIRTAPDSAGAGLVALPVWLWSDTSWGPLTATDSAGGYTLYAEARITQITWDMGDGGERVCTSPGQPYSAEYGADEPTCGYRYAAPSRDLPGGVYEVTATAEWRIDWHIQGTTIDGVVTRSESSSTTLRINELQVVTSWPT